MLRLGISMAAHVRETSRARWDEAFVSKSRGAVQEMDESQMGLEFLRSECGIAPATLCPLE